MGLFWNTFELLFIISIWLVKIDIDIRDSGRLTDRYNGIVITIQWNVTITVHIGVEHKIIIKIIII